MTNDLAGSIRFTSHADVPRCKIEALNLSESLYAIAMRHLQLIETAPTESRLQYAHGRADGHAVGLEDGGILKGQQCAYVQSAFQLAHDKRLAELRAGQA